MFTEGTVRIWFYCMFPSSKNTWIPIILSQITLLIITFSILVWIISAWDIWYLTFALAETIESDLFGLSLSKLRTIPYPTFKIKAHLVFLSILLILISIGQKGFLVFKFHSLRCNKCDKDFWIFIESSFYWSQLFKKWYTNFLINIVLIVFATKKVFVPATLWDFPFSYVTKTKILERMDLHFKVIMLMVVGSSI